MALEEKDAERVSLLQALYELSKGESGRFIDYGTLSRTTQITPDRVVAAGNYLIGQGFVDPTFSDKLLGLTHQGVVAWEAVLRAEQEQPANGPADARSATLVSETTTRAPSDFDYDVCLSFAGEDREYVQQAADCMVACGIRVFYDRYEEATLWGKDLYAHLDAVYRERARFCVIFVSAHYARKLWSNHERQSAQARAFGESREYVLPARFDDTPVPGLRPTVGFIDLRHKTPSDLAALLQRKLGDSPPDSTEYPVVELKVGTPWSNFANVEVCTEIVRFNARRLGEANFEDLSGATTQTLYELRDGRYRVYVQRNHRGDYGVWTVCGADVDDEPGEPMKLAQLQQRFPELASQCGLPRIRVI
jgi:hypothetical protein